MKFNRSDLLTQVKKAGYTGKADPAEVKAFLAASGMDSESIEIPGDDGAVTAVKFDDIWAKTATLALANDADEVEDDGEAEQPTKKRAESAKPKPGAGWKAGGLNSQLTIINSGRDRHIKRYENRIAAKAANPYSKDAAIFDTPEDAEAFSAWTRLQVARQLNIEHGKFGEDMDVLKRYGAKTGVTFSNTLGGATVPSEFMPNLIWRTEQYGAARKVANVVRMSRDAMEVPRKTGIVSMAFTREGDAATAQDNSYDNVSLVARKAVALVKASTEWMEDSAINVADDYGNTFAEAQAICEDNCFFLGDGSATYGGFTGLTAALPSSAYLTGVSWSTLQLSNFNTAFGSLQNVKNGRIVMVGSRQFYHQVCVRLDKQATQFKDAGASYAAGFNGADASFLGFPYIFSQVMPTATGTGVRSCYIGDISGIAMLGDRRDLRIDVSKDRYFDEDVIGIRATSRIAVNVHGDGRASTVGPVACIVGA